MRISKVEPIYKSTNQPDNRKNRREQEREKLKKSKDIKKVILF